MLLTKIFRGTKKLQRTVHTLTNPKDGYIPPKLTFETTTTVWRTDELIKKRKRDWERHLGEDGYSGIRESVARKDLTIGYTGTYSVFPVPLAEWIIIRFGGKPGSTILDAFSGGPPRGLTAGIMGYEYVGYDISAKQIEQNAKIINKYKLDTVIYKLSDARNIHLIEHGDYFDFALTCPPYWNMEVYSDDPDDFSAFDTYDEFHDAMFEVAKAHFRVMKPGAFVCIIVGNFRDKKTGEIIDFRGHTVCNFQDAGFLFHQEVILAKNFGSAVQRSSTAWKGKKLVSTHEHLLVFKKYEEKGRKRVRL